MDDWLDEYVEPFLVQSNQLIEKLDYNGKVCVSFTGEVVGEPWEDKWSTLDLALGENPT
eukprot:UN14528